MNHKYERVFPVLISEDQAQKYGCPTFIPWDLVALHASQVEINHQETVAELSAIGLTPDKILAVLEDREWVDLPLHEAVDRLKHFVQQYKRNR